MRGDMESNTDLSDPHMIALNALVWMLADTPRAERLLALTGLDADALRAGVGDPTVLAAILEHLTNYEPDLIACAADLHCSPDILLAAHRTLAA